MRVADAGRGVRRIGPYAVGRSARAVGAVLGALTVVSVGFAPNAAAYDAQTKQWYLKPMKAEQMWKASTGKGVKVAVIDTGVNANTPSLKGRFWLTKYRSRSRITPRKTTTGREQQLLS